MIELQKTYRTQSEFTHKEFYRNHSQASTFVPFQHERSQTGNLISDYNSKYQDTNKQARKSKIKNFLLFKNNKFSIDHLLDIPGKQFKTSEHQPQHHKTEITQFRTKSYSSFQKNFLKCKAKKYHPTPTPYVGYYDAPFKTTFSKDKSNILFHKCKTNRGFGTSSSLQTESSKMIKEQSTFSKIPEQQNEPQIIQNSNKQLGYVDYGTQIPRGRCNNYWLQKSDQQPVKQEAKDHKKFIEDITVQVNIKQKIESVCKYRRTKDLFFGVPQHKIINQRQMSEKYKDIVRTNDLNTLQEKFDGKYTVNFNHPR